MTSVDAYSRSSPESKCSYPLAQQGGGDIGIVPYVSTYVRTYVHILSSLQRLHLLMDFNITTQILGMTISRASTTFRVLGSRSRSLAIFRKKNFYDNISSKFNFQGPGLKVKVTVAFFFIKIVIALICKLIHPYPILRGNSCQSSTGACKIYGKCAGSQLPLFYRKNKKFYSETTFL